MRKIKLKFNSTKLKAFLLCAVASVGVFYSCNQDDLHHHNHEHQSNISAKKLSPEEALQIARKLNGLVNNGKHNTLLISEQSLSVANNSVDFSTVNLIESINGTKTYAFAVNDSNLEDNIIKNVILQEFQNEIVVKEVSYNMTDSFKQQYYNGASDFKSFQGTVTFETVFGNPCPDDADPISIGIPVVDDNDGNGGSGYGGYIPIGGFPDGGINNGGLFNSIGGGGSGGGGGGYAYLQCTNCSRTYGSRSEMDGSICAGYNYIIVISFSQNQNVVPNNSPCDPSTTLPVAEIEFVTKAREFQRNLTPEQRTWTQQNPTSYTQILNYLRNENWSNESEVFAEELINELSNISIDSYPGKEDLFPFEWWNDDALIEQYLQGPYESWRNISSEEKRLTKSFPTIAYKLYKNKDIAFQKTFQYFGNVPQVLNGKPDAFRHAFFQAINTVSIRKYFTELFANAHESEVPTIWSLEKEMDLYNNEIGMNLIEFTHPNWSNTNQIATEILNMLNNGELIYLKPINYSSPYFWDNPSTSTPNDGNHGISNNTQLTPTNQ